jgi:hypothetical protein
LCFSRSIENFRYNNGKYSVISVAFQSIGDWCPKTVESVCFIAECAFFRWI